MNRRQVITRMLFQKRFLIVMLLFVCMASFPLVGCEGFRKGVYNSSHFRMTFPYKWKEGSWTIPTVLPAGSLYDPEIFVAESPAKHKPTGTPAASISLFAQKMEQVVWMEDIYPVIIREYERSGYKILQRGEIKIGDQISKWVLCRNDQRDEIAMDFYVVDESSFFYKLQYASHKSTFNEYRYEFEAAKETLEIKFAFF